MKRYLKIFLAAMISLLMIVTALPATASAKNVTLNVNLLADNNRNYYNIYQQFCHTFEQMYPNIDIKENPVYYNTITSEEIDQLLADFRAGNEPDVLFFFESEIRRLGSTYFVSVEEIRKYFPDYAKDIYPSVLDAVKEEDGKTYRVPIGGGWSEGLIVNKKIFEDYGLALPTDWDKLIAACKKLSTEGIIPMSHYHYLTNSLFSSAAGDAADESDSQDSLIAAINGLKLLFENGAFFDEKNPAHTDGENPAMHVGSDLFCSGLSPVENFTVLPFPAPPGGRGGNSIGVRYETGFYISKKAFNDPVKRQAAVDFVSYMTSRDAVEALNFDSVPAADVSLDKYSQPQKDALDIIRRGKTHSDGCRCGYVRWHDFSIDFIDIRAGRPAEEVFEEYYSDTYSTSFLVMRLNNTKTKHTHNIWVDDTSRVDPTDEKVYPFTLFGKTMVPVRFIENLGANVKYNGVDEPVTITYNGTLLTLEFDNDTMKKVVNGGTPQEVKLPTAPTMVEGKTCVPIREIAENLGFTVSYNSDSSVISVTKFPVNDYGRWVYNELGKRELGSHIQGISAITAILPQRTIKQGEYFSITADDISFEPANPGCKRLLYSSDNTNVATVTTRGRIDGISKGTAKITVTSHNGKQTIFTIKVN